MDIILRKDGIILEATNVLETDLIDSWGKEGNPKISPHKCNPELDDRRQDRSEIRISFGAED